MENNIKILRLVNGEDVICQFTDLNNGEYNVLEPMSVSVREKNNEMQLAMSHWLPVNLISKNEINLKERDILTIFEPNDNFSEYYTHTVEKMHKLLQAKEAADKMTDEEIMEVMDALEDMGDEERVLH